MIKFSLICDSEHGFDAWFRNSGDFDRQVEMGILECPHCQSVAIRKALMAPAVATARQKDAQAEAVLQAASQALAPGPTAPPGEGGDHVQGSPTRALDGADGVGFSPDMMKALRKMRQDVTANADYVGDKFAEEARKMHFEETAPRGIYGEASLDDVKSLTEDGVPVLPLPSLPDDLN